jgi:hypothetical protein
MVFELAVIHNRVHFPPLPRLEKSRLLPARRIKIDSLTNMPLVVQRPSGLPCIHRIDHHGVLSHEMPR